jgi:hypothetical protein
MSRCGAVRYQLHAYREDFLASFLQFKRDLLEGENVGTKIILDFRSIRKNVGNGIPLYPFQFDIVVG